MAAASLEGRGHTIVANIMNFSIAVKSYNARICTTAVDG